MPQSELDMFDIGDLAASKLFNHNNDMQNVWSITFPVMTIGMLNFLKDSKICCIILHVLGMMLMICFIFYLLGNKGPDVVREIKRNSSHFFEEKG